VAEEIILIITPERNFRHPNAVLSHEGFTLVRAEDNNRGLQIVFEINPALILMNHKEFRLDGLEFMEELRARKISTPVIIYDAYATIEEFIESGVHDYIVSEESFNLVNSVKKALIFRNNPKYISVPLAEKLLEAIEWQRQENRRLKADYEWYKENVNRSACNCQQLIDSKERAIPKSTALEQLGRIDLSPMHGDYYVCQVCETRWINWTEVGFGNFGGWELAEEYDDVIESGDITYFEEPPEHGSL
jgi:DNA-binding response OmpR family regulator